MIPCPLRNLCPERDGLGRIPFCEEDEYESTNEILVYTCLCGNTKTFVNRSIFEGTEIEIGHA